MTENLTCNFCGKNRDSVEKLIAGPGVYICNECVNLSYQILSKESDVGVVKDMDMDSLPTPQEIRQFLDDFVVGQDSVKEILSVSAYNHYKRIYSHTELELEKSNIMLIGPTGSGKTLFAKTLSKILDVPFVIADATTLTESGYVGDDAESILERLLAAAEYDVARAQQGIIYIDEIDKKAKRFDSSSNARDVSGEGVQQALLRLIEGTKAKVKIPGSKKTQEETVELDTSHILFVVSGAFVGIEEIVQKRKSGSTKIGFVADVSKQKNNTSKHLTSQDVINFGIIPELMGRLPVIAVLEKLTVEEMVHVLAKVKNNLVDQYVELLSMDKIQLEIGEQYLSDVAEMSIKQDLGARALRQIMENSMISIMYRAPELQKTGVERIVLTKYPTQQYKPELVYSDGKTVTDTEYKLYRGIDE